MAQPTRHRTRLAREERREQIVAAAAEVFEGRDPAEVTFEEIAERAGVSRALVYNYFGDRHGLLEAVYRREVDELQGRVQGALATLPGGRDALAAAIRVHLDHAAGDPTGYRYAAGETAFARLPELHDERVADIAHNLGGGARALLVAKGLLAAIQAMVLHWLDHRDLTVEETADVMTVMLWEGLEASERLGLHLRHDWSAPS